MTKKLITINQFIQKSLGEWKSIRSTHSLAFQEVENSTSKIVIKELEINNKNVIELLEKYNSSSKPYVIALSISWKAISDWEVDQKIKEDKTILLFLPKDKNKGIVLRNKGYTESEISSSEYLIDKNANLNIKTFFIARYFGRDPVRGLVGSKAMKRIESFNQNQLEENFFLMTGLLMTGLFDFLSYAIGIGGTRWKIFTPALLISLLISDSILVAVGAGVSQGAGLFLGIALLGMFALATISGLAKRRIPK